MLQRDVGEPPVHQLTATARGVGLTYAHPLGGLTKPA